MAGELNGEEAGLNGKSRVGSGERPTSSEEGTRVAAMNNGEQNVRFDQGWPEAVRFTLGVGREGHGEILWRCNAVRAGKLYTRTLFGTRAEAEDFAQKMKRVEPDQMFDVESIKASSIWN